MNKLNDSTPIEQARPEVWPGQHEHHRQYEAMLAEHATTGVYRDPVTGRVFPPGSAMLRDPNREQRRRLAKWRKS